MLQTSLRNAVSKIDSLFLSTIPFTFLYLSVYSKSRRLSSRQSLSSASARTTSLATTTKDSCLLKVTMDSTFSHKLPTTDPMVPSP